MTAHADLLPSSNIFFHMNTTDLQNSVKLLSSSTSKATIPPITNADLTMSNTQKQGVSVKTQECVYSCWACHGTFNSLLYYRHFHANSFTSNLSSKFSKLKLFTRVSSRVIHTNVKNYYLPKTQNVKLDCVKEIYKWLYTYNKQSNTAHFVTTF